MDTPGPDGLCERVRGRFRACFGGAPDGIVVCPGRVNLIGDHTDYAGGVAMPMAIDRHVVLAWGRCATHPAERIEIVSDALGASAVVDGTRQDPDTEDAPWVRYVRGVIALLRERGVRIPGLRVLGDSTLPIGSGLSSSAAFTIGFATALARAGGVLLPAPEMIDLARRVECEFAGVPCGTLDQTAIVRARPGHALLIDFGAAQYETVALPSEGVAWIVIDSRQRRMLADGVYAQRRAQCEQAARVLGVESLGMCPSSLGALAGLPEDLARRARHVIGECARVRAFGEAMRSGDLVSAGRLMYESHDSLRDDFEVSCERLDAIREAGERAGALGVRLTGAGLGGCCIALVRDSDVDRVCEAIAQDFERRFDERPGFLRVRASGGVCEFNGSGRRLP